MEALNTIDSILGKPGAKASGERTPSESNEQATGDDGDHKSEPQQQTASPRRILNKTDKSDSAVTITKEDYISCCSMTYSSITIHLERKHCR